jgi:ADP-ribose pyrophosphatase YjhB (NUDIX family)
MVAKDRCCSYCGHAFRRHQPWPRTCAGCARVSYRNPLPVGIVLLPVGRGLLAVRRSIAPGFGKLALPGGYIGTEETWQEAAAREVFEETGIRIDPAGIHEFRVLSTADAGGLLLVFGLARRYRVAELPPFVPTDETSERVILTRPQELAFPAHTVVVAEYFKRRRRRPTPRAR